MSVEPGNKFAVCKYCCYITGPIINGDIEANTCVNENCLKGYDAQKKTIAVECRICSDLRLSEPCLDECINCYECHCENLNAGCERGHLRVTVKGQNPKSKFAIYHVVMNRIPFPDVFQSNSQTKITAYFP